MEYRYHDGAETHVVRLVERDTGMELRIGDRSYLVEARWTSPTELELWIDGRYVPARVAAGGTERWVALDREIASARLERRRRRRRAAGSGEDTLAATMPGQIVAVEVAAGDTVERGQTLVIMEAMKMELRVAAPHDGAVARVHVTPGDSVDRGQILVELEKE